MNKQLCISFMKECNIAPNFRVNELKDDQLYMLAKILKCWKIKIKTARGFDFAQVTAGGADCSQFNSETMESKLIPGLYFAGEIIDIDGTCGGYNLQWAFTSGYIAGKNV